MKKLLLLTALIITCLGSSVSAQYATHTALPEDALLSQDPETKAALLAAADDTIEERIDDSTGKNYYVRRYTSPWTGESSYQLVVFDMEKEAFVEREIYALWHQEQSNQGGDEIPEPEVQDSCLQQNILPEQQPHKAKPRRSSTVKILAHKF
ncbi:MAG: hypothetical protein AAGJ93_07760 [Bacteroidota bacterium]